MVNQVKKEIGNKEIIIETGKLAKQADGAVTVRMGDTMVLVTSVCSKEAREGIDFFPLMCEYQEKTYSAGKIPGGYFKREGRPTEKEILTSRLIDRPIRPLFPEGMKNDVQIVATVISIDGENDPDILAMIGSSAALSISDIPFNGPVGAVRVGRLDGKFIINPTAAELDKSDLDLLLSANDDNVVMIEAGCDQLPEATVLEAIDFGHAAIREINKLQKELAGKCGRKKREVIIEKVDAQLLNKIKDATAGEFSKINQVQGKEERQSAVNELAAKMIEAHVDEQAGITEGNVKSAMKSAEEESVRKFIVQEKKRVDGRSFDQIRPISSEVGLLPRTHGSALFTRGQTQSLSAVTLGNQKDEQFIDDLLSGTYQKNFMLHYNFPSFSVGEVRPMRGPGRREIGHGALAERALKAVIPSKEDFPYTMRIVSEILESNGSSSMATVCAGTLSLMDAGVPIKSPVSGIAMGLITEGKEAVILTDIAGVEDHFGDMDFKVAGTDSGITAIQMDIKITGIKKEWLQKGLDQALKARKDILAKMRETIKAPKEKVSEYAPRIVTLKIPVDKIGEVIGPSGRNIKKIIEETKTEINIEDDGTVQISGAVGSNIEAAEGTIRGMTEEPEIGTIYPATVKRIMPFGAFCEFLPGRDGLVHVSEMSSEYVKAPEEVVKEGDHVTVKLIGIDERGRAKLSMKQAAEQNQSV